MVSVVRSVQKESAGSPPGPTSAIGREEGLHRSGDGTNPVCLQRASHGFHHVDGFREDVHHDDARLRSLPRAAGCPRPSRWESLLAISLLLIPSEMRLITSRSRGVMRTASSVMGRPLATASRAIWKKTDPVIWGGNTSTPAATDWMVAARSSPRQDIAQHDQSLLVNEHTSLLRTAPAPIARHARTRRRGSSGSPRHPPKR